jgi:hypothetical protein
MIDDGDIDISFEILEVYYHSGNDSVEDGIDFMVGHHIDSFEIASDDGGAHWVPPDHTHIACSVYFINIEIVNLL